MSYYFFYEQATICSVEHEGSHIINNYCECEGWEVTRRNTLDKDGGIKETVCIGRVSERYCTRKLEGKVFETDCE